MASSLNCSLAASISVSSSVPKHDGASRRPSLSAWWVPIFGWSSDPDYVGAKNNATSASYKKPAIELETGGSRSIFAPGCFTEEKAKQLRRKTRESESFHDLMYHSAIASRLAYESNVSDSARK